MVWEGGAARLLPIPIGDTNEGPRRMNASFIVLIALIISSCAGISGGGNQEWTEQVILPNGQELIVGRSHTLGSRFDRELSAVDAPLGATSYAVLLPGWNGRTVRWEGEHKDFVPIAVAVNQGIAYVVAIPSCRTYLRMGRPSPPFLVFKHSGVSWETTTIAQFPFEIPEANLLIGTDSQRIENANDNGLISAKAIRRLNEGNAMRHIYRQGTDRYVWAGCG